MDYTQFGIEPDEKETKPDYTQFGVVPEKKKKFNPDLQPTDEWLKPTALEKIAKVVGPAIAQTARLGAQVPKSGANLYAGAGSIADLLGVMATGGVPRLEENKVSKLLYEQARKGKELSEKMAAPAREFAETPAERVIQDVGAGGFGLAMEVPFISKAGLPAYSGLTSYGEAKSSGANNEDAAIAGLGGVVQGAGTHALFGLGGELPGQVLPRAATATAMGAITKAGGGSWEDVGREAVMAAALTKGKPSERPGPTVTSQSAQDKFSEKVSDKPIKLEAPKSEGPTVTSQSKDTQAPEIAPPGATSKGKLGPIVEETAKSPAEKEVAHGGVNEGKVGIEVISRAPEVVVNKDGSTTAGKLGDEGVIRTYKNGGTAYRRVAGNEDVWESFGKGPSREIADPELIAKLNAAGPSRRYVEQQENVISEAELPTAEERAALGIKEIPASKKIQSPVDVELTDVVPPPVQEPGQGIRQTVTNSLTKELGLRVDEYVGKEKFYDKEKKSDWWDAAANRIKNDGVNPALTRLLNTEQFDKVDVTEGRILLRELREQGGRDADIAALAQKMAVQGSEMGRGLAAWQNFDVLKNPEVIAAKIFREAKKKLGNKTPQLTPEMIKILGDMARDAENLTGRDRVIAEAKIYSYIRNQVPKSIWKKISTVQAIHQLLNAKTIMRNIIGNTGLEAMEIVSHYAGLPGDYMLSKFTGQRSVVIPRTIKHLKDIKQTFDISMADIKDNINTSKSSIEQETGIKIPGELENMFEFNAGETFKGNTFYGKLEKLVGYTLQAPDRAFFESRLWDSADNMIRAGNIKAITPEIQTQALTEAARVTFRDMNSISKALVGIKKALNTVGGNTMHGEFGLGDLAIKYPKVPGAILKRGIEYSPFGLLGSALKPLKLAYKGIKGQSVSAIEQRNAVLSSARGVVGTALAALGYAMIKSDEATGKRPENPKVAAFFDAVGWRPYSIKTKKGYISYDWLQPAAMPFTMGVSVAEKKELERRGEGILNQVINYITDTAASAGSSIADQPVLTGLSRLAGGEKYGGSSGIVGGIEGMVAGSASSFVPTLFSQIAATLDPTKRIIPKDFAGRMEALVVNRIPLLSKTLDARKSVLGENMKRGTGNVLIDTISNLVSPTIYSKLKDDLNVNLISQLYAQTKDTDVLPSTPGAVRTGLITYKNQIYEMTPKQISELQESIAKTTLDRIASITRGSNFNNMSNEVKIKMIKRIYDYAGNIARKKMLANLISEKRKSTQ